MMWDKELGHMWWEQLTMISLHEQVREYNYITLWSNVICYTFDQIRVHHTSSAKSNPFMDFSGSHSGELWIVIYLFINKILGTLRESRSTILTICADLADTIAGCGPTPHMCAMDGMYGQSDITSAGLSMAQNLVLEDVNTYVYGYPSFFSFLYICIQYV